MGTARANSLMMVKDYNSNDSFREDNRLLSIADTPSIAFSIPEDILKSKNIVSYAIIEPWREDGSKYNYSINYQFIIHGDPSRSENWELVTP